MANIDNAEIASLEAYMQTTFGNDNIALKPREKAQDSVEVLLHGEFIGLIYKDDEDGETSYDFNMAILAMDLPQKAG